MTKKVAFFAFFTFFAWHLSVFALKAKKIPHFINIFAFFASFAYFAWDLSMSLLKKQRNLLLKKIKSITSVNIILMDRQSENLRYLLIMLFSWLT